MAQSRRWLPRRLGTRCPVQRNGFVLPLALGGSLLLLLSTGSLQLLALQNRARVVQLQRRHQVEDTLASAAQQQVAALQAAGSGCLLGVELAQWPMAAASCGISPEQLETLQQGQLAAGTYRVAAYRLNPTVDAASTAELELQLSGERPWRAAYRLSMVGRDGDQALHVTALQDLGLRGARA